MRGCACVMKFYECVVRCLCVQVFVGDVYAGVFGKVKNLHVALCQTEWEGGWEVLNGLA